MVVRVALGRKGREDEDEEAEEEEEEEEEEEGGEKGQGFGRTVEMLALTVMRISRAVAINKGEERKVKERQKKGKKGKKKSKKAESGMNIFCNYAVNMIYSASKA